MLLLTGEIEKSTYKIQDQVWGSKPLMMAASNLSSFLKKICISLYAPSRWELTVNKFSAIFLSLQTES